jgi:hypothetical protein
MTLHDYLLKNLEQTVMIALSVDNQSPVQYNYWNWFHDKSQLHLLKEDYSIGHILHTGSVTMNDDGSINHVSKYHPKECILNFYFGGVR